MVVGQLIPLPNKSGGQRTVLLPYENGFVVVKRCPFSVLRWLWATIYFAHTNVVAEKPVCLFPYESGGGNVLLLPYEGWIVVVNLYFQTKAVMGKHYFFHIKEVVGNLGGGITANWSVLS